MARMTVARMEDTVAEPRETEVEASQVPATGMAAAIRSGRHKGT